MTKQQVAEELETGAIWRATLGKLEYRFPRYKNTAYLSAKETKAGGLEESLQDAVLEAHEQHDHKFNSTAQLGAWIYQVAERAMLKKIKAHEPRTADHAEVSPAEGEGVEEALDRMAASTADYEGDGTLMVRLGGTAVARLSGYELEARIANTTPDEAI